MRPEAGDMDRSDGLGGEAIRCPSCGGPVSSVDGDLYCVACGWSGPREAAQQGTLLYECQLDLGGCSHRWKAPETPDAFIPCPQCGAEAGAVV